MRLWRDTGEALAEALRATGRWCPVDLLAWESDEIVVERTWRLER